ncbi:hypothetical protein BKA66DRAFT_416749, partial [Pyrenochaeta sp. MPI-SDFR-AT-0127]
LHVAAGISYKGKGIFIFYSDPVETAVQGQYRPCAPSRSSVETEAEHTAAINAFKAATEDKVEVRLKGNSMAQKYYAQRILSHHLDELDRLEAKYGHKFYFQADNNDSHGTGSFNNLPACLKRERNTLIIVHPANPPDLNPIESM